jgi:succinyl-CoA synthetase alpha subunit
MEAADAGVALVVCITEGHPDARHDARDDVPQGAAETRSSARIARAHLAGKAKAGIIPGNICKEGRIGIVSKSGTLTYEAIHQLTRLGLGQTTCIGIGGDPLIGTSHIDALSCSRRRRTDAVIMIGEIGGSAEEEAAAWIKAHFKKPVSRSSPARRRLRAPDGHAGAIIAGGKGTAAEKMAALSAAGVKVVQESADMGKAVKRILKS